MSRFELGINDQYDARFGAKAQTLYLAGSVEWQSPMHCSLEVNWQAKGQACNSWSINYDNGSEVTKDVSEVTLTSLANLTYTDKKYMTKV